MSAMEHVRYLAGNIGPRGSTTDGERRAARYAAEVLRAAGLTPVTETFSSARSAWLPYTLSFGLILVAGLLFWVGGRWGAVVALVLTLLSLASVLLELAFRPNPLRWLLPNGESTNVWARVAPRHKAREQVVLIGHLDTHRTPLVFSTDAWVRLFRTLIPVGLASVVILVGLFVAHLVRPRTLWQILSGPPVAVVLGVVVLTLQADLSSYTVGANDNATGAGVVLELARRIAEEPLDHTEVWAVLSGCEEVGCYGADAFARAHRGELGRPAWIAVDSVGGKGADPTWVDREVFFLTAHSDRGLLALADGVARRHPELGAAASTFQGAYTEGSIGHKHGFRVLTLVALRRDGRLPHWHRPLDVTENVDPDVVARSEGFLWELLHDIDRSYPG